MKKTFTFLGLASLSALAFAQVPPAYVPGEMYVKFVSYTNGRKLSEAERKIALGTVGGTELQFMPQIGWSRVKLKANTSVNDSVTAIKRNRLVTSAEPIFVYQPTLTPNDPMFASQKWLTPINVKNGWDLFTGLDTVNVAILDTGCQLDHPDLQDKFLPGEDMVNLDGDPMDGHGHGTGSAGMAAADTDNGIGVAAPGWNTSILPVLVGEGGGITHSVQGIIWAADNGANIISMSYGGGFPSQAQQDAVNYAFGKNIILMASAGNSGLKDTKFYPAGHENVVSVGASDDFDNRADFSNYGDWVMIAAPGVNTLTTSLGSTYGGFGGTSAACPAAAGVTSVIKAFAPPSATNTEVIQWLKDGCEDIGPWNKEGRVDLGNSLALIPRFVDKLYPIVNTGMVLGSQTSGGIPELLDRDTATASFDTANQASMKSPGTFMYADFDVSQDMTEIENVQVTLNSFANAQKVTQMLYVWNWNTNKWKFVKAFKASTLSASTDNKGKVFNAQTYMSANGLIRIGVRAIRPSASGSTGFRLTVDRIGLAAQLLAN